MSCKLCEERQKEIDRILKGYRKDKDNWKRERKIWAIAAGVLIAELIMSLAYGKDGILLLIEIIMKWFGK